MSASPDYVIIADPNSLRWQHYQRDLDEHLARLSLRSKVHLLNWADVIARDGRIADLLPTSTSLLRVESPARDFSLFRLLMQAGETDVGAQPSQWEHDEGWIASPNMLYRGLCRILSNIEASIAENGHTFATSNLTDTQTLFDKNAVSRILTENNVPTPGAFRPESVAEMHQQIESRGWPQAYVKLAYGSCASGIAVLDSAGSRLSAVTTVARIDGRFYNTYDVRKVESEDLASILGFLVSEVATVQQPIEKARVGGDQFDVRMVVIAGEVVASVFRASNLPMTNLHLGGYRADPQQCRRVISDRAWADAVDACWRAAQLFDMAALGIDLAFDRHTMHPQIIEINAFGDFFPSWTDDAGRTIHQIEVAATAARFSQ